MVAWTKVMAVEVVLTGQILDIFCRESSRFTDRLNGQSISKREEREVMLICILKDGIPITKMGDWRKKYICVGKSQFSLGHIKCEMSINIQVEMLNGQMETQVKSVVQGEAGLETNSWWSSTCRFLF